MPDSDEGDRPPIWVGHIGPIVVPDLDAAVTFYEALGLVRIHGTDELVALQLRGGTHLVLLAGDEPGDPGEAPFDLMVADIDAAHARASEAGLEPSAIDVGGVHRRFFLTDPGGHRFRVHDSHVVGPA